MQSTANAWRPKAFPQHIKRISARSRGSSTTFGLKRSFLLYPHLTTSRRKTSVENQIALLQRDIQIKSNQIKSKCCSIVFCPRGPLIAMRASWCPYLLCVPEQSLSCPPVAESRQRFRLVHEVPSYESPT